LKEGEANEDEIEEEDN